MHLGRMGLAVGVAASVMGGAWAAVPGSEGLMQLRTGLMGQQPVQPADVGLTARGAGRVTKYVGSAPRFEVALPAEWKIYRSPEAAQPGQLNFLAGLEGGATPRAAGLQRWPDGTLRSDTRAGAARGGNPVNGLIAYMGRRVSDADLQELRAFAVGSRTVSADGGRQVEVHSYKLYGSGVEECYN